MAADTERHDEQQPAPPAGRPHIDERDLGPLVLVAEDSDISCEIVKALLHGSGLRVEVAHNGVRAWRLAVNKAYAAILMDCQMPGLDGWEATRRIRAAEVDFHVPIIAMTGVTAHGSRERCLTAGMDDYLAKPLRREQLDAAIARWLSASHM
jgi:CheY-like chemotaxis protein